MAVLEELDVNGLSFIVSFSCSFFALCLVLRCAAAASDDEVGFAFFCCDEIFPYGWLWLWLWLRDGWDNEGREKRTYVCTHLAIVEI